MWKKKRNDRRDPYLDPDQLHRIDAENAENRQTRQQDTRDHDSHYRKSSDDYTTDHREYRDQSHHDYRDHYTSEPHSRDHQNDRHHDSSRTHSEHDHYSSQRNHDHHDRYYSDQYQARDDQSYDDRGHDDQDRDYQSTDYRYQRPDSEDYYHDSPHRQQPGGRAAAYMQDDRRSDYRDTRTPTRHSNQLDRTVRPQYANSVRYPVKFHGKTSEYFKIWIVNIFLTLITLYIYSAWAKVRTKRYFYGNTTVDNSSFEYHAKGSQLVVGRLIATTLIVIYTIYQGINATVSTIALGIIIIMFPWAVWRSLKFNAKASSFRNIRFGFDGVGSPPYNNIILIPLAMLAVFGLGGYLLIQHLDISSMEDISNLPEATLMFWAGIFLAILFLTVAIVVPLLHKNLISYSLNNHRYGTAHFTGAVRTGRVYVIYLITILLSALALIAIAGAAGLVWKIVSSADSLLDNSELLTRLEPFAPIIIGAAFYLIAIPIGGIAVAYFRSSIRNHRYNVTSIDGKVRLKSETGTWSLWWLNISNLILLIITLGLAFPYAKIRSARYFAARTSVFVEGGLDSFTANEKTRLNAMGEEMADAFDVEFDIGI